MADAKSYDEIRVEAELPQKERKRLVDTKKGKKIPRRYHLKDDILADMLASYEKTGIFPNPYRKGGVYCALVQALINLGVNEWHDFVDIKREIRRIMEANNTKGINAWQRFENKKPKNVYGGKGVNGRIVQNARILQRLSGFHPYGEKLRQLRACIDLKGKKALPQMRLNTRFKTSEDVAPINETT